MGYFTSDLESDIFKNISNTSFLFSPELGFTYDYKKGPISLNWGARFYVITAKDGYLRGTLQSLYFNFDIYYKRFKK